jgi:hypothetical protein
MKNNYILTIKFFYQMKRTRFIFSVVCLSLLTSISVWALELPTSGEYYVIKHYTNNTYIGGSASGKDAVKHEDSATNTDYHVFLVNGDNTDGYTLTQQYTGNQIRYDGNADNKYTLFYATSGNSVPWTLTDKTDYFNLVKKSNANSKGIGADNVSSGQTLYSNKDESSTLPNKWLFIAGEAATILINSKLTPAIAEAQTLYNANTGVDGAAALQTAITAASSFSGTSGIAVLQAVADLNAAKYAFQKNILLASMENATSTNPVDITLLILNPSFEEGGDGYNNSITGWTQSPVTGFQRQTNTDFPKTGNTYAEKWKDKSAFSEDNTLSQTITNLPDGVYMVTAMAAFNYAGGYVFANDNQTAIDGGATAKDYTVSVRVEGGSEINLGIKAIKSELSGSGACYLPFDNFRLHYYGTDVIAPLLGELTVARDAAQAYYNAINSADVAASGAGDVTGKYSYDDYTALAAAISAATGIIDQSPTTASAEDITAAKANLISAQAACVLAFETNTLLNGDYFVKVGGYYLNLYDTPANNAATTVALGALVADRNISDASQIFNIAKLSGADHTTSIDRYAVFNSKNMSWHIADNGRFRNDWGSADNAYRTVNFLYNGTKYAWQFAGSSASKGFLKLNGTTLENDNNTTLDAGDYVFDIIPVADVFAEEVAAGRTLYNAATEGDGDGEYSTSVMTAFDAVLDAAEANSTPSKEDLFAYAAARKAFAANFVIPADDSRAASEYTANYGYITFNDGSQLTGASGIEVAGVVKVVKTLNTGQWYAVGFPFEVAGIKIGETEGVIYNGTGAIPSETAPTEGNADEANLYAAVYNGNAFELAGIADSKLAANTGYILAFPKEGFSDAASITVTFTSGTGVSLNSAATAPALSEGAYTLLANPNTANLAAESTGNDYYYQLNAGGANFGRPTTTLTYAPFESYIAYRQAAEGGAPAKVSLNIDGTDVITGNKGLQPLVKDPVVETQYYNLQGVRIGNNKGLQPLVIGETGVYIVKQFHASGKTSVSKSIIR